MSVVFSTDFESLSVGSLDGQGGWSTSETSAQVVTDKSQSGTKSIYVDHPVNSQVIWHDVTISGRDITVSFWIFAPGGDPDDIVPAQIDISHSDVFLNDGITVGHDQNGFWVSVGGPLERIDEFSTSNPVDEWYNITVRVVLSTVNDAHTDVNADGEIVIERNGVVLRTLTNIKTFATSSGFGSGQNLINRILFVSKQTWLDDIEVTDDVIPPSGGVPPPNDSTPCCGSGPTPDNPDPSSTPNPGNPPIPLQPWTRQCAGGGDVPTAADVVDAESWTL